MSAPSTPWWPAPGGAYSPRCQCPIARTTALPEPGLGPESDALLWLSDDDPRVREAAVVALSRRWRATVGWLRSPHSRAELQDAGVTERIGALTDDPDERVAAAASRLLRGDEAWDEPLPLPVNPAASLLHVQDIGARLAAARWASGRFHQEARRHDTDEVELHDSVSRGLRQQFARADWLSDEVRQQSLDEQDAADAAFHDGPGVAVLALAEEVAKHLLDDPACLVRVEVLRGLSQYVRGLPLPGVVARLEEGADSETCAAARHPWVLAIASSPNSAGRVDAALTILRGAGTAERCWLAGVAPPAVMPALLRDHDPAVRRAAMRLRTDDPLYALVPWSAGMDVVPDRSLGAEAIVAEFDALWSPVLQRSGAGRADPEELWSGWPERWRSDRILGQLHIVEPWLLDLIAHTGTSPVVRFRVFEELLQDFAGTRRYDVLLGTAGNALVAEAVQADWFSDVWDSWLQVVAALPARDSSEYPEQIIGDPDIAVRLCWSPPRVLSTTEHVEFWRRSGEILWRASCELPTQAGHHADPLWRSRLTSLGLAAELLLEGDGVAEDLRPAVGRAALYAPGAPLAVITDVPRWRRPGDPGPTSLTDD